MVQTDYVSVYQRLAKAIPWTLVLIFSFHLSTSTAQNGAIVCNDLVQVSLNADCEADIQPDMILEGNYSSSYVFEVNIQGVSGTVVTIPGNYSVTVTDLTTGNYCWGNMVVEDKLAPVVNECLCPVGNTDPQCEFLCTDLGAIQNGTLALPEPIVTENCDGFVKQNYDAITDGACGGKLLTRTWVYTDGSGNTNTSCTQEFRLNPVDFNDVVRPINPVNLDCGAAYEPQDILAFYEPLVGRDSAIQYAYPTVNGQMIDGQMCNIMSTKTDIVTKICDTLCANNNSKIIRRWVVLDWCNGDVDEFVQIIKSADTTPPTIDADDITVSVDAWGCKGSHLFEDPATLTDKCSSTLTYRVEGPLGVKITYDDVTGRYYGREIPMGTSQFVYIGEDCCGNEGRDTIQVTVRDLSSPVAIAKQNIVVSLTTANGTGQAKVFAASVDNGSHDGCTGVRLEVRRDTDNCNLIGNDSYNNDGHPDDNIQDQDDGKYVRFCCDDLTDVDENGISFGVVKVWLRVWDDGDRNGQYGTAGDNYNETWAMVRVDDKLAPKISCPADVVIECTDDINDPSLTGTATGSFTCESAAVDYVIINDQRSDCGFGDVYKRWFLVSDPSISCLQKITVREGNLFDGNIDFPPNRTTDCVNLYQPDEPTWNGAACSSVGYSLESDTFQFVDNVCFKIFNTFTVIDWCQYDPSNPQSGGIWTHTQIIKVVDEDKPVLEACTDITVDVNDATDSDNDGITCEAKNISVSNSAVDNGDCASDWLKWEIRIDLNSDGIPDYEYTSFVNRNDNSFTTDNNNNGIPDKYLEPTMSGEVVTVELPEDLNGPMSNHKVSWTVTDGCGNRSSCITNVMVTDNKPPTPYCTNISSALMEITGIVELWAVDFNLNSFDNCTAPEDLLFTIDNAHPVPSKINTVHFFKGDGLDATLDEYNTGVAQKWDPTFNSSSMIFNCDDVPFTDIAMTITDEKGNSDFCNVRLNLLDNFDACAGTGTRVAVRGNVSTENGTPMSGVQLVLDPQGSELEFNAETDADGNYAFNSLIENIEYDLSTSYDDNYDSGVSTLDLVLIQRYILGIGSLDSPYKIIAADINGDEGVRGSDVVQLRKLILGIDNVMPDNESWRFVDKAHVFADPSAPWPVQYVIGTGPVSGDLDKDLVAIKIGDVNLSTSNLNGDLASDVRSANVTLFAQDRLLTSGEITEVAIKSSDAIALAGYQLAINLGDVDLLDVKSSKLNIDPSHYNFDNGILKISYAPSEMEAIQINDQLFTLEVRAKSDVMLSDILSFTDELKAEVYTGTDLQVRTLDLGFEKSTFSEDASFALYQNQPNPFKEETTISFILPEAGQATLTIYDLTGKTLFNSKAYYAKGMNTVSIHQSLINATGVLYYTLESGNNIATKKMIQIQ